MDKKRKKKKTSINMMSLGAPIHLRSATFHHGEATNAMNYAFTILFCASTVQDGSASTCFLYCIPEIAC